ncbi:MAG: hypothetical protein ACE5MB_03545 [Anaerolineae bacterium]
MAERRSVWSRIWGFFWGLIKLILALAVIAALGVGIYYGGLYAYYGILSPINSNTNAINVLQGDLETAQRDFGRELQVRDERIAHLAEQIAQLAAQQEAIKALEEKLASQDQQVVALQEALAAHQEALAAADKGLTGLETKLAGIEKAMDRLAAQAAAPEAEITRLKVQALLLQASSQALKARMRLMQNNAGLAKEELGLMEPTLEAMARLGDEETRGTVEGLRARLEATLAAIDENPFVASEELDILWHEINATIGF